MQEFQRQTSSKKKKKKKKSVREGVGDPDPLILSLDTPLHITTKLSNMPNFDTGGSDVQYFCFQSVPRLRREVSYQRSNYHIQPITKSPKQDSEPIRAQSWILQLAGKVACSCPNIFTVYVPVLLTERKNTRFIVPIG